MEPIVRVQTQKQGTPRDTEAGVPGCSPLAILVVSRCAEARVPNRGDDFLHVGSGGRVVDHDGLPIRAGLSLDALEALEEEAFGRVEARHHDGDKGILTHAICGASGIAPNLSTFGHCTRFCQMNRSRMFVVLTLGMWTRRDTIAATTITLAAAAVRFIDLSRPASLVNDEGFYARDGCWYVVASSRVCGIHGELSTEHPPLAKWLIGGGIRTFGFHPFGWRFSSAAAGTLTVLLLYVLARRLLRSTTGAVVASGLLAIDFLHLVESRTAMLEPFVTLFLVAAFLFWALDRERLAARGPEVPAWSGIRARKWRVACGVALGGAVACKWSGLMVLLGIAGLSLLWEIRVRRETEHQSALRRALREEGTSLAVAFLLIPAAIYVMSYIGRIHGPILALPWHRGSWARNFVAGQVKGMLLYHVNLHPLASPYASPPWSWPLLKRPMTYFFAATSGGRFVDVLATGDPVVWWASLIALVAVAVRWRRSPRGPDQPEALVLAGFALTYLPWLGLGYARSFSFFYYMCPAVPFMCLALAMAVCQLRRTVRLTLVIALATISIGLFGFFYPVLTGAPLAPQDWKARMVFTDCRGSVVVVNGRAQPYLGLGPPPAGWCWL
jgi:dolichyl-phosphate-mannose-protein mannosyltransferase